MLINDLIDNDLLVAMIGEGYIRQQQHPTLPLIILNYTEKTQFDRKWNDATLNCRGLIFNYETNEIVARPFSKFFNYGEDDVDHSYYSTTVTVTDKLDGSLGIIYPTATYKPRMAAHESGNAPAKFLREYAVATRGSFTSPQALHATKILNEKYPEWQRVMPGLTYLVEIIYPENRIVCDYEGMDDLVLIGAVDIEEGWCAGPRDWLGWLGPKTKIFDCATFQEAIELPPRNGAEGIVVYFPDLNKHLKIKQADYVHLHRLITGLNERSIWEFLRQGKTEQDICENLPDEFHQWVRETASGLKRQFGYLESTAHLEFNSIKGELNNDPNLTEWTRKDFALRAVKTDYPSFMFALLDGRSIDDEIWKRIRPESIRSQWAQSEETA